MAKKAAVKAAAPKPTLKPSPVTTSHPEPVVIPETPVEAVVEAPVDAAVVEGVTVPDEPVVIKTGREVVEPTPEPAPVLESQPITTKIPSRAESDRAKFGRA